MSLKQAFLTDSPEKTKKLGEILAQSLMSSVLICLYGDLGSGKTTFAQGFAAGLGIREKITSPSFVLMKRYLLKKKGLKYFYHFDCYRLREPEEILALGWEEILGDNNIVLVEWAEKIQKYLPQGRIGIRFEVLGERKRGIIITNNA
ncbi:MAG: tRNA (adenosine(37)-N6)-threonylcarbamoyltransferase complex ATPase subunit type 1 TsaE [Patescibacteria group bacterium]|nr:tRNA (adenosine(37)-N6)-threonylcarbamoyltransferase complex ATPase subunit type 1 TsaE [Patescibacteria group bacterium]